MKSRLKGKHNPHRPALTRPTQRNWQGLKAAVIALSEGKGNKLIMNEKMGNLGREIENVTKKSGGNFKTEKYLHKFTAYAWEQNGDD